MTRSLTDEDGIDGPFERRMGVGRRRSKAAAEHIRAFARRVVAGNAPIATEDECATQQRLFSRPGIAGTPPDEFRILPVEVA